MRRKVLRDAARPDPCDEVSVGDDAWHEDLSDEWLDDVVGSPCILAVAEVPDLAWRNSLLP